MSIRGLQRKFSCHMALNTFFDACFVVVCITYTEAFLFHFQLLLATFNCIILGCSKNKRDDVLPTSLESKCEKNCIVSRYQLLAGLSCSFVRLFYVPLFGLQMTIFFLRPDMVFLRCVSVS